MPTTSRPFFQPLVTPSTALNTSARARPWTAACLSSGRSSVRTPSFCDSVMPSGIRALTLPLGPSTVAMFPLTVYFTPAGMVMGFLPIRDISKSFVACESLAFASSTAAVHQGPEPINLYRMERMRVRFLYAQLSILYTLPLPDFSENLSANVFAASLAASHDALRRGHDRDAEAALDAANLVLAQVHAAAGTRDALQVANDRLVVRAVLQVHADHLHAILFGRLVVRDVAFLF